MVRENDIVSIEAELDEIVSIWVDGVDVEALRGETVLSTLFAIGKRKISKNDHGKITGAYCGMGICFCCTVIINNVGNRLACQTVVQEGMRIETQKNSHDKEGLSYV